MSKGAPIGSLNVTQSEINDGHSFEHPFDLVLGTVSWETRGSATAPILKRLGRPVSLLRFESKSPEFVSRKDANEKLARDMLGESLSVLAMARSQEFHKNAAALEQLIQEHYARARRPLRIAVDMTCLPKAYLLYLMGCGFEREYLASIDFVYAKGNYILPPRDNNAALEAFARIGLISQGEWSPLQIPYFEANDYTSGQKDLFVSVGAEVAAALPVIERFEPQKLRLFKITESVPVISDRQLSHEEKALRLLSEKPNTTSLNFGLDDVIGLSQSILNLADLNTTCLVIGSKPHAIACGLASLARRSIEIVCRIPASYSTTDVTATGHFYHFRIEDRFEPRAFL